MKYSMYKLAAALTTAVLASESTAAFAQSTGTNFSSVATNIVQSSSKLPNLISTVAYIGGVGMGVAGVFKLKQHVDNPAQSPMKDGLVRLGAGGGLLVLPYVTQAMMGTINGGQAGSAPTLDNMKFNAATFN